MQVTSENFSSEFPKLEGLIKNASFIAVDTELTGITPDIRTNSLDSHADQYEKLRVSSQNFLVIQVGLSICTYEKSKNSYSCHTYNFYVFPRENPARKQKNFLCEVDSMRFLSGFNFDFNKLIKEGITYLRASDFFSYKDVLEKQFRHQLNELKRNDNIEHCDEVSEAFRPFINDILTKVGSFVAGDEKTLQLGDLDAYQRRLVYRAVKPRYADKGIIFQTVIDADKKPHILLTKIKDMSEAEEVAKQEFERKLSLLEDSKGFTRVMEVLTESKAVVIGHNMFVDSLHLIGQFLTVLPEQYEEYKELIRGLFPRIVDTKVMASQPPLNDHFTSTSLERLYRQLDFKPFVAPTLEIPEGYGYDPKSMCCHEAGFDAFMTAQCFIRMGEFLKKKNNCSTPLGNSCEILEPYFNKTFILLSPDLQYFNLGGEDIVPDRSAFLHLQVPEEWKTSDILCACKPYGYVNVYWLNKSEVFISLKDATKVDKAYAEITEMDHLTVTRYSDWLEMKKASAKLSSDASSQTPNDSQARKRKNRNGNDMNEPPSKLLFDECDQW